MQWTEPAGKLCRSRAGAAPARPHVMQPKRSHRDAVIALLTTAADLDLGEHRVILMERFQMSREEAEAGEEHLAFECLCDNHYEYDVRLPSTFLVEIQCVGDSLGVDRNRYAFLAKLVA